MRKDFLRRKHQYFISYSHSDAVQANALVKWLAKAKVSTFFDTNNMPAGGSVRENLAEKISESQGFIVLASETSLNSSYVKNEIDQALREQEDHPWYPIIILNIDGCDIASQWKNVRTMVWTDAPDGRLKLSTAAEILSRHHSFYGWDMTLEPQKEIYVSHGWREGEDAYWAPICKRFIASGIRLVGDLVDQPGSDESRITEIMSSCGGHLVVLPNREGDPTKVFKYLLKETEIAKSLGLPCVVIGSEDLSPDFTSQFDNFLGITNPDHDLEDFDDDIEHFIGTILTNRNVPYTFFASQYKGNYERNRLARKVIESAGALPCRWGRDYQGDAVASRISEAIQTATYMLADLSAFKPHDQDTDKGENRDQSVNLNACIEAGIARGAGKNVYCLAAAKEDNNPSDAGKSDRLPFMFRNDSIFWYENDLNLLATVHELAQRERFRFGRRIINYEFP